MRRRSALQDEIADTSHEHTNTQDVVCARQHPRAGSNQLTLFGRTRQRSMHNGQVCEITICPSGHCEASCGRRSCRRAGRPLRPTQPTEAKAKNDMMVTDAELDAVRTRPVGDMH
eukprot:2422458-Prymnesium_polylepis.1